MYRVKIILYSIKLLINSLRNNTFPRACLAQNTRQKSIKVILPEETHAGAPRTTVARVTLQLLTV